MLTPFRAALAAVLFAVPIFAAAHEATIGTLTLTNLWTRATPPGARTGAGYLTIANTGNEPDRLIAVATALAEAGELHEMKVENGRMSMRPLPEGIVIAPGETVTLAPGGFHLMFVDLREGFVEGGQVPVTLTFEKAGALETFLHVQPIGAAGPEHEHHHAEGNR